MVKFSLLLATGTLALAQQYTISTVAGGAPPATPVAATGISIGQPARVATDSAGNVYFSASNAVFKISAGGTLTLVAGTSRAGYSGDGGLAIKAQLNSPQGMAVDPSGNIYIADSVTTASASSPPTASSTPLPAPVSPATADPAPTTTAVRQTPRC